MSRTKWDGYFEAWTNGIAWRKSREDNAVIDTISRLVQEELRGQTYLAGSQRKGTSIVGSDIDLCVMTRVPVTVAQRKQLAKRLAIALGRPARPGAHAIRIDDPSGGPHIDIAFANAEFGDRPLPDPEPFRIPRRKQAARALKWWLRERRLPHVGGWAVEAIVVRMDQKVETGAQLFLRILEWVRDRATPQAIESILRPAAQPRWYPAWSRAVPGRLEAIRNAARHQLRLDREVYSVADVEAWLSR